MITENVQTYKDIVFNGIFDRIPEALKRMCCDKSEDLDGMISLQKNGHGEYDMQYPQSIDRAWSDFYENGEDTDVAIEYLLPGVLELLNGQASVM